jgi:hypothetical protein
VVRASVRRRGSSAGRLYCFTNQRLPNQGCDMAQMQNGSHLEVPNTVGFTSPQDQAQSWQNFASHSSVMVSLHLLVLVLQVVEVCYVAILVKFNIIVNAVQIENGSRI